MWYSATNFETVDNKIEIRENQPRELSFYQRIRERNEEFDPLKADSHTLDHAPSMRRPRLVVRNLDCVIPVRTARKTVPHLHIEYSAANVLRPCRHGPL
jgi:hypothetical protein